jgi:hypothetical protein
MIFLLAVLFFLGGFVLDGFLICPHGFFEASYGFAYCFADVRKLARTEKDKDDNEDHQQFGKADITQHEYSSFHSAPRIASTKVLSFLPKTEACFALDFQNTFRMLVVGFDARFHFVEDAFIHRELAILGYLNFESVHRSRGWPLEI